MLRSLTFRDFRNLEDATWEPEPGLNLVFGLNGAGKSSLLEAAYLVSTTKSFRTARLQDCRRHGSGGFHIQAETDSEARTRLEVGHGDAGKRRAVNDNSGSIAEHLSVLPVVAWTTRDTDLFHGPPALRRQFVDRGLVAERVTALAALSEYRRALEAKKAALERQPRTLAEWNAIMAAKGATLSRLRSDWIQRLQTELDAVLDESRLGFEGIELRYRPSPREAEHGEAALLEALEGLASREISRGSALVGPHRDDLEINWHARPVGRRASAGERKILGLALLVAHARLIGKRHPGPLYLVDDLDAELDRRRVEQVWEVLVAAPQLVATSSRKGVVRDLAGATKWHLERGVPSVF